MNIPKPLNFMAYYSEFCNVKAKFKKIYPESKHQYIKIPVTNQIQLQDDAKRISLLCDNIINFLYIKFGESKDHKFLKKHKLNLSCTTSENSNLLNNTNFPIKLKDLWYELMVLHKKCKEFCNIPHRSEIDFIHQDIDTNYQILNENKLEPNTIVIGTGNIEAAMTEDFFPLIDNFDLSELLNIKQIKAKIPFVSFIDPLTGNTIIQKPVMKIDQCNLICKHYYYKNSDNTRLYLSEYGMFVRKIYEILSYIENKVYG